MYQELIGELKRTFPANVSLCPGLTDLKDLSIVQKEFIFACVTKSMIRQACF